MLRNVRVSVQYEATKPIVGSEDEEIILKRATHRIVIDDEAFDLRVACELALKDNGIVFKNILKYQLI